MSQYLDKPEDLLQDTKNFLNSEYGQYIVSTLEDTANGHLANADNMECPYPERYLAKHSAIKEVLDLIKSPLDDDTPSQGK
jgi:hypothetical protein